MKLKNIAKLGVIVSVTLFCVAVGAYFFANLYAFNRNKDFNLYNLVPSDALCVVESDNINYYFNEFSHLSYANQIDSLQMGGVANFVLNKINDYCSDNGHGLNSKMGHIVISMHDSLTADNQILYFYTDNDNDNIIDRILKDYISLSVSPKKEKYMDKNIFIYPINNNSFLSVYRGEGYRVVSFQKRLIERVIECQENNTGLAQNKDFMGVKNVNKSHNYLTLYNHQPLLGFMDNKDYKWSEFNFNINSDVIYLTGETSLKGKDSIINVINTELRSVPDIMQDSVIITTNIDSMRRNISDINTKRMKGKSTLFDECVAGLSSEASFMMVMDMDKLNENGELYKPFVLPFIWEHKKDFKDFILSSQLSLARDKLIHVIILTYKN